MQRDDNGYWHRQMVQSDEGFWIHSAAGRRQRRIRLAAMPAVQRAGLNSLNEGQEVEYELVSNRGKESAVNLKTR
jgi:hypothetical protein